MRSSVHLRTHNIRKAQVFFLFPRTVNTIFNIYHIHIPLSFQPFQFPFTNHSRAKMTREQEPKKLMIVRNDGPDADNIAAFMLMF
jgi:hypothetical protein